MFNQILGDEQKRVGKWAAMSLIFLSLFLVVKTLSDLKRLPTVGREIYPQSTIAVSGKGEAFAIPDIATFSFSVTEAGEDVKSAQGLLDEKISKGTAMLKAEGIDEKDIKTTNYNVYPKYEWNQKPCAYGTTMPASASGVAYPSPSYPCPNGKNELVGYEVTETITVKVRDVKKAGDLVSKIGAVDVSNISGVEFTVDDRDQYVAQAREEAIKKAKEEGKLLAKQLGVRLGKILYFNEGGGYMPYYEAGMGGDMMKSVSATPARAELPPGETKITSEITITYEIK